MWHTLPHTLPHTLYVMNPSMPSMIFKAPLLLDMPTMHSIPSLHEDTAA